MNSPDTLNQPKASEIGRQFVRRAEGDELFDLLEELEPFSAHPAVSLPQDPEGRIDPLVKMTNNRDINENRGVLGALMEDPDGFLPKLTERFPDMAQTMPNVTVGGVRWNKPSERFHRYNYLWLLPDADSTLQLKNEQKDLWQGMQQLDEVEDASETSEPDWEVVMPSILVMRLNASAGSAAPKKIFSYIKKKVPFDLELLPLGDARPAELT